MNAQQVPQCKQSRLTYLLSYTYVRNPVWIETTVRLFLLYICHTVIHRKLQNVVYMKKKSMLKKRGDGQSEAPKGPVHKYLWFEVKKEKSLSTLPQESYLSITIV